MCIYCNIIAQNIAIIVTVLYRVRIKLCHSALNKLALRIAYLHVGYSYVGLYRFMLCTQYNTAVNYVDPVRTIVNTIAQQRKNDQSNNSI